MTDIPYNNWLSMSDDALAKQVGLFIKHHRLDQNKTQGSVAEAAGISRSANNNPVAKDKIKISEMFFSNNADRKLRVLDKLQVMDAFVIQQRISPLALAKVEQGMRKRARNSKTNPSDDSNW